MNDNYLTIENLNKSFNNNVVLKDASLKVAKGESMIIMGGSGSGKSVFVKCILGLLKPDSGSIILADQQLLNISNSERMKINSNFGVLFQQSALFDSMDILSNLVFALKYVKKMKKEQADKIAKEVLKDVGLNTNILKLYPNELSGGMKKRVALARAIAVRPLIMIIDEPTSGLDPITGSIIRNLIASTIKKYNATTITITHDVQDAMVIGDKIAMLYQGNFIFVGKTSEMKNSSNKILQQFIHGRIEGAYKII